MTAALLSIPVALALGKDLNWDFQNYHLYAGFSAFASRWQQDFMPASIQSYLVPYAHAPLYWMVRADMPAMAIGATLALMHSLNAVFAVWIAQAICPSSTRRRLVLALLATVALVYLTPIYLNELGTSFIDISSSVPIVAAVALLLHSNGASERRAIVAMAGFLLGLGTALKLTNLIFIPATVAMCFVLSRSWHERWSALVRIGWSSALGYLLIAGYWHYMTWEQFGNPFFPFFNALFQSPEFPNVAIRHQRFLPESSIEYLTRWLAMAIPARNIYTETAAPDIRLAAIGLLGLTMGWRSLRKPLARTDREDSETHAHRRQIAALAFMVTAYTCWMATSGNGRYFMPALVVAAPLLVALVTTVFGSTRAYLPALLFVLAFQGVQTVIGADLRWNPNPWRHQWIDVQVPNTLATHPRLYLSIDMQSSSFLAPFVHPQSGFVNVAGQYAIGPGTPGFDRLRRMLIERRDGDIMLLTTADNGSTSAAQSTLRPDDPLFRSVARLGLESDGRPCEIVEIGDVLGRSMHGAGVQTATAASALLACGLRHTATLLNPPESIDRVFNMIEQACPQRFAPNGQLTVPSYNTWMRIYVNSDVMLWIGNGHLWYRPWNGGESIPLGTLDAWLSGHGQIDCTQRFIAVTH